MELFPALLIGGPPHSGKSVLAYNLSQAFRQAGLDHYLLRACPDGEGDWANEIDQSVVRTIRLKGEWSLAWVDQICRDIARRHLPLLVDVGGRPEPWQERIFSHCTHAVLLAPTVTALNEWRSYAQRYGLTILAELESSLTEPAALWAERPVFRARLAGLERGCSQQGSAFAALVDRLSAYFRYPESELRHLHLSSAPVETVIDLDRLARTLDVWFEGQRPTWQPRHLPEVLDYLPAGQPLGLYGRGPNWLYTAVALHCQPAPFYQFDVRLGWVTAPRLALGLPPTGSPLRCEVTSKSELIRFNFVIQPAYLDYTEAAELTILIPPRHKSLVIGGKIPHWLTTALAVAYRYVPVLAVHQPQIGHVVVSAQEGSYTPGQILPDTVA